jgi:serine/threonine protein kinase/predicted ATPase
VQTDPGSNGSISDLTRYDPPTVGDVVGQYELQEVLGKGGMATVWLGEHRSGIGLRAAVKILHPHLAADDVLRQQLLAEARALARLRHANLVQLLDFVPAGDSLALVTELVEGQTLRALLKDSGALHWTHALDVLRQLLHGVGHAHERGCLHLDLKPSNLMLTPDGLLKVLDFGLAAVLEDGTAQNRLRWATPAYMAPEQHDERDALGRFTDLYSIGVVLYELLFGRENRRGGMVLRVSADERQQLVDADVPLAMLDLLDALLQLIPIRRPATCEEALEAVGSLTSQGLLVPSERPTYQAPTEPEEVPTSPTHSRPSRSTNVRPSSTSFVGREEELEAIATALLGDTRLLTLHGLGGCGKTRLAVRFAEGGLERFPGGVWHCDLAEAEGSDGICAAVAHALDVDLLREEPAGQLADVLAERGPSLLLFDHADADPDALRELLPRWLAAAPNVRFLITSYLPLDLPDEARLQVGPLPMPSRATRDNPAIALFVQRACEADPSFDFKAERMEVLQIVRELDGLPLALEIAAARVGRVPLKDIRHRLMAGDDESGQALRSTLLWSWTQLRPFERASLATLAVFQGGFSTEAAAAVLDLSPWSRAPRPETVLRRLVDGGLLRSTAHGRFALLHSIHAFALERLMDPDAVVLRDGHRATGSAARAAAHRRHAGWFARFGQPTFLDSLDGPGGVSLRAQLTADLDNLGVAATRAAQAGWLHEACACAIAVASGVRLAGPLSLGRRLIDSVLSSGSPSRSQRAHLLLHRGSLARQEGRTDAEANLQESLLLLQRLGDRKGQSDVQRELGMLARERGRLEDARESLLAALDNSRAVHDRRGEGRVLGNLAVLSKHTGEPGTAQGLYEVALALHRDVGNRRSEGIHLAQLALLKQEMGDLDEATHLFGQALSICRQIGNRRVEAQVLGNLALVHKAAGRPDRAARLLRAALEINRHVGARRSAAVQAGNLGDLCLSMDRLSEARTWLRRAVLGCQELGFRLGEAAFSGSMGSLSLAEGRTDNARAYLATGEAMLRELGNKGELGKLLCRRGELDLARGDILSAAKALKESERLAFAIGSGPNSELVVAIDRLRDRFGE